MSTARFIWPGLAAVLTLTLGCIKRTEQINVLADGTVSLMTVIEGGPEDVRDGDAMPQRDAGWHTTENTRTADDGETTLTLTGVREIPAGKALPDCYAAEGTALAAVALRFPTTLTIERRPEGTYYHFRRTYQRRTFNQIQYYEDHIMETDPLKDLKNKDPDDLLDADVRAFALAFIEIDKLQTAGFIEQAALHLDAPLPQDTLLRVRQSALQVYDDDELLDKTVTLVQRAEDADFVELEREVRARQLDDMQATLQDCHVAAPVADELLAEYNHARQAFEVSEDLADEQWLVSLEMPGQIIAHNATEENLSPLENDSGVRQLAISATYAVERDGERKTITKVHEFEVHGNTVAWEFGGRALHDRDVLLMATSLVPAQPPQDQE